MTLHRAVMWLLVSFWFLTACHDPPKLVPVDDEVPLMCIAGSFTLTRANPSVMLVLDRSGSMASTFGAGSRWSALTQGLAATLPAVDDSMELGALFFPQTGKDAQCSLPSTTALDPSTGQVDALVAQMRATSPSGGTPTADAIDLAASVLSTLASPRTAHALLLATDGAPDCNASLPYGQCTCLQGTSCQPAQCLDDARTVSRVAAQAAAGLPTYVIGIHDGGDQLFSSVLERLASAGGRARHGSTHGYYAADSQSDLQAALSAIRDEVGSCIYLTNSVPTDAGAITVTVDGAAVPYDASGASGWQWGRKTNGEIVLQGETCAAVMARAGAAVVKASITCSSEVLQ